MGIGGASETGMRATRDSLGLKEQRERLSENLVKKRFRSFSFKAGSVKARINHFSHDYGEDGSDSSQARR